MTVAEVIEQGVGVPDDSCGGVKISLPVLACARVSGKSGADALDFYRVGDRCCCGARDGVASAEDVEKAVKCAYLDVVGDDYFCTHD